MLSLPFPCQTLEGIMEALSQLSDGWIHLQTRKSAPPILWVSLRILDSLAETKLSARSQTFFIFFLQIRQFVCSSQALLFFKILSGFRLRCGIDGTVLYWPVLRLNQGVSDVGDGQVGLQVLVLLARLTVAPQHIWTRFRKNNKENKKRQ